MNLEEIKKKKLKELEKQQIENEQDQEQQLQQQIEQIESVAKQYLDRGAILRYNNLKLAHKEKAMHAIMIIFQAAQAGQLKNKLTDREFKEILRNLDQGKKEFNIKK